MNRREVIFKLSAGALGCFVVELLSCQKETSHLKADGGQGPTTVMMNDIIMVGLITDSEDVALETGTLPALDVKANLAKTFPYNDPHGHTFTVGPEEFKQLLAGQTVRVRTTFAQNHDHIVRIDPKYIVTGSQAVAILVGGSATPTPTPLATPTAQPTTSAQTSYDVHAALGPESDQRLAVSGRRDLSLVDSAYCVDTQANCAADSSLWHPFAQKLTTGTGQPILVSGTPLNFDPSKAEQFIEVRGKFSDGTLAGDLILKLTNK